MKSAYLFLAVFISIVLISGCAEKTSNGTAVPAGTSAPIALPAEIENNCVGFLIGSPEETSIINTIGGGWTRPHPGPFAWGYIEKIKDDFDFSEADRYVQNAQNNGVAILATVWPFADWDQNPDCKVSSQDTFYPQFENDGIPAYRCKPSNMQLYHDFLMKLVERYDGDGINDMPGLKIPVKYWEILNEPEMASPELTFFKGTPAEYVEILKASSEAVKSACSDCKIVQGGAAGIDSKQLAFWENVFTLSGGNYFDIANIHFISFGDESTLNTRAYKALLDKYSINKPIWVTEVEFKDANVDVKLSVSGALNAGASKIFFVSFKVGGHGPPSSDFAPVYKEVVQLCPK